MFIHHDAKGRVDLAVGRRAEEDHKGLPGPQRGLGFCPGVGRGCALTVFVQNKAVSAAVV